MSSILFSGVIAKMIPVLAEDAEAHIGRLDELLTLPSLWVANDEKATAREG